MSGCVVCAIAAFAATAAVTSSVRSGHRRALLVADRGIPSAFSVANPLPAGQLDSLSGAESNFGSAVPLPSLPNASAANVGQVWWQVASDAHRLAVSFPAAGFDVIYSTPVGYSDPAGNYGNYVQTSPAGLATVVSVDGTPALSINQGADALGTNPGSVEYVIGDVKVVVLGDLPASSLEAAAVSIDTSTAARQLRDSNRGK